MRKLVEVIPGVTRNMKVIGQRACFVNNGGFYATEIKVFADGYIDCWGLMREEEFLKKTESGWITVDIPSGSSLRVCDHELKVEVMWKFIEQEEFVKEIIGWVRMAEGSEHLGTICMKAYSDYVDNPCPSNKELLRTAYQNVPEHMRRFMMGDQDAKDWPIREILEKE